MTARTAISPSSTDFTATRKLLSGFAVPALFVSAPVVQHVTEVDLFGTVATLGANPAAFPITQAASAWSGQQWFPERPQLIVHTGSTTAGVAAHPRELTIGGARVWDSLTARWPNVLAGGETQGATKEQGLNPSSAYLPVIAWVEETQGSTSDRDVDANTWTVWAAAGVAAAIAASMDEHFESGYVSRFSRNLSDLYKRFGSAVIEALCTQLRGLARPYSGLLRESFGFLAAVQDRESSDLRLVFLASYLNDPSPINRDSAAVALADLGDKRGSRYLREASEKESHPRLKYEFLEIAAELEV